MADPTDPPDDRHPALPDDYVDRDVEANRRYSNQRHRPYRRKRSRERWLGEIEAQDPAAAAELVALRAVSAQAYRKALVRLARKLGVYSYFDDYGDRDMPPLAERRAAAPDVAPEGERSPPAPEPPPAAPTPKRKKK